MNVITNRTINNYCDKYPEASEALRTWTATARNVLWKNFNDVKKDFPSADVIGDDRMVFNIKGNHYRLVVRFSFPYSRIMVKWFGRHKDYDHIDCEAVEPEI